MTKKTISKIWMASIFSLFLINPVLAQEANSQDTVKKDNKFFDTYMKNTQKFINQNVSLIEKPEIDTVSNIISPLLSHPVVSEALLADRNNLSSGASVKTIEKESTELIASITTTTVEPINEDRGFFNNYIDSTQKFLARGFNLIRHNNESNNVESTDKKESLFTRYSNATQSVLLQGFQYIGVPYRWGGNTEESGFDCSGFVRAVFQNSIGMNLPRTAKEMSSVGEKISMNNLKPGDLVFFNTMRRAFSHVGIYMGDNKFLHSPRTGEHVQVEDMDQKYWQKRFNGARRLVST
jgi:cell wall-associated NlpC family hydrolase